MAIRITEIGADCKSVNVRVVIAGEGLEAQASNLGTGKFQQRPHILPSLDCVKSNNISVSSPVKLSPNLTAVSFLPFLYKDHLANQK
jgi:hypothetical protein